MPIVKDGKLATNCNCCEDPSKCCCKIGQSGCVSVPQGECVASGGVLVSANNQSASYKQYIDCGISFDSVTPPVLQCHETPAFCIGEPVFRATTAATCNGQVTLANNGNNSIGGFGWAYSFVWQGQNQFGNASEVRVSLSDGNPNASFWDYCNYRLSVLIRWYLTAVDSFTSKSSAEFSCNGAEGPIAPGPPGDFLQISCVGSISRVTVDAGVSLSFSPASLPVGFSGSFSPLAERCLTAAEITGLTPFKPIASAMTLTFSQPYDL